MIYLVTDESGTRTKIGRSSNPKERMRGLQIGSPEKLKLYAVGKACKRGDKAEESLAHYFLRKHRVHGEWFALSPEEVIRRVYKFNIFFVKA